MIVSQSQNKLAEKKLPGEEKTQEITQERLKRFKKAFEAKWLKEKIKNSK
jgi:hypothetical protein